MLDAMAYTWTKVTLGVHDAGHIAFVEQTRQQYEDLYAPLDREASAERTTLAETDEPPQDNYHHHTATSTSGDKILDGDAHDTTEANCGSPTEPKDEPKDGMRTSNNHGGPENVVAIGGALGPTNTSVNSRPVAAP